MPNLWYSWRVGSAYIGYGQFVSFMYIGIRSGEPQPITTTEVGGKSCDNDSGVREEERVRRYSWQFCTGRPYQRWSYIQRRRQENREDIHRRRNAV